MDSAARENDRQTAPEAAPFGTHLGIAFWVLFSILAVFVRGIRWDEHWDLAQVILKRIPYPEEHFLYIWTRDVRNLPIFLSTAVARLTDGPAAVNAFRNILWLLATTLPLFLIGTTLSRRALCGHVAVVLGLWGLATTFDASYPLYAWPAYFSNGHVGMGYALIALACLISGGWRVAAFMLGFMPAVHVAHMPPVAIVAALCAAWAWKNGEAARIRRALVWMLPGIAVSTVLWLMPMEFSPPTSGPYYATGEWEPISRAYMAHGTHWSKPGVAADFTNSTFILAAALLLTLGAARAVWVGTRRIDAWAWLSVYLMLCGAAVWGMMFVHTLFEDRLPYALLAAMPYRVANHAAVLAMAILPAILLATPKNRALPDAVGPVLLLFVLLYEGLKDVFGPMLGSEVYARYIAEGDGTVYAIAGMGVALLSFRLRKDARFLLPWIALWIATWIWSVLHHQFGAACFALGIVAAALFVAVLLIRQSVPVSLLRIRSRTSFVVAVVTVLAVARIGFDERRYRTMLPVSAFDRAITAYLAEEDAPDAMLVSHPLQHRLQSRTEHPVLVDSASADSMVYTPELAPSIQKIHEDLYGIRYYPPPNPGTPPWNEIWKARTRDRWGELGRDYGFEFVLSPIAVPLDLEVSLAGPDDTLYRVSSEP